MRKTSSQLDWGVFVSFYSSDAFDYVSDSNSFSIDPSSTCYKWGPQQGDVSLFSLDGFSIGEHSYLSFGVKLQPRLKVISPNETNNVLRMAIGRLRWFNVDIKTNEIVYEQLLESKLLGGGGRRRNSFYFTGPPIYGNVNEIKQLKRNQLSKKVLGDEATLEIEYEAMKYFDPEQGGNVGQILILSITLVMRSIEVLYNAITKSGHRITCQVQLMSRPSDSGKRVQLTKVYLGRAQKVITNEEEKKRRMVWKSDPTVDVNSGVNNVYHFPGFTPRSPKQHHWEQHVEESQDIQLIQMLPMQQQQQQQQHTQGDLSARHSISIPKKYIPDNDEYGNPTHRLPVFFCKDQQLTLKFFNFKFTPPRCVEHTLKWGDFEAAELRELMSPRAVATSPEKQKKQKNPLLWMKKKIFSNSNNNNKKNVGMPPLIYTTNEQRALERPLIQGLTLRVYFRRKKFDQVKLDNIALIANNYEESLDMLISKVVTV